MRPGWKYGLSIAAAVALFAGSGALAQDAPPAPAPTPAPPRSGDPSEVARQPREAPPPPNVEIQTECAAPRFRAQLMTPMADRTPRDASLVVGLFAGGSARELPTVQLRRGRRSTNLVRVQIAPGLFRLTPDVRRIYGRWDVEGVEGSAQIVFGGRPGLPPPPARPDLTRVERYRAVSGGASRVELRAHFAFPIPDGVVAVVSYFGADDDADLFARGIPRRDEVVLWASSGRCSQLPEGASDPPTEGTIRVAFVDQYGQLSALSDPRSLAR